MSVIRYLSITLLIPLIAFAVGTLSVSRFYWGYWLVPPSSDAILQDVESVERFSSFWWDGTQSSGRLALIAAASTANYVSGDDPMGRLPAAFVRRALYPSSSQPVDPFLMQEIIKKLASLRKLVRGSLEYPHAASLHGHLALARTGGGKHVVVAALAGGQVSNDHYPYYEAVFAIDQAQTLTLRHFHFYFFDVAGLEGVAHWLAGVVIAIGALLLWLLIAIAVLMIRFRRAA